MRSRVAGGAVRSVRRVASALLGIGVSSASDEGASAPRLCGMQPSKALRRVPSYSGNTVRGVRVCSSIFSILSVNVHCLPCRGAEVQLSLVRSVVDRAEW